MFTQICPHEPFRRWTWLSAITRRTAHLMCGLVSDLVVCKLKEHGMMMSYITLNMLVKPLNNIKLKLYNIYWFATACFISLITDVVSPHSPKPKEQLGGRYVWVAFPRQNIQQFLRDAVIYVSLTDGHNLWVTIFPWSQQQTWGFVCLTCKRKDPAF